MGCRRLIVQNHFLFCCRLVAGDRSGARWLITLVLGTALLSAQGRVSPSAPGEEDVGGRRAARNRVIVKFRDAAAPDALARSSGTLTHGLCVNLPTDGTASSLNGWGWQNGCYWLSQATTVTFASSGTHTMRIQLREDGVQLDQIVLSPKTCTRPPPLAR